MRDIASFLSISFFGSINQKDGEWTELIEDPKGWHGKSDLIVTTSVPRDLFEYGDEDLELSLVITLSLDCAQYIENLGTALEIYKANANMKTRVFKAAYPPGISADRIQDEVKRNTDILRHQNISSVVISASMVRKKLQFVAKYTP